jgi:TetR/AcrR family transcriptional regulator, transcriptional repressor for nem operon
LARTREFDEDEVLDAALQTFRRKGYEATTLPDLLQATGLARQSLYNAFGDKRELFLASLRRYAEAEHRRMAKTLEGRRIRAALAAMFDDVLHRADRNCGCFLVNAASELLPRDPEVGRVVASAMARQETTLAAALRRAVRSGELRLPARRVEQTARFLVGVLQGLVVLSKAMPGSPAARDAAAVALRAIE